MFITRSPSELYARAEKKAHPDDDVLDLAAVIWPWAPEFLLEGGEGPPVCLRVLSSRTL